RGSRRGRAPAGPLGGHCGRRPVARARHHAGPVPADGRRRRPRGRHLARRPRRRVPPGLPAGAAGPMSFLDSKQSRASWLVLLLGLALVVALWPYASGLLGAPVLYSITAPLH